MTPDPFLDDDVPEMRGGCLAGVAAAIAIELAVFGLLLLPLAVARALGALAGVVAIALLVRYAIHDRRARQVDASIDEFTKVRRVIDDARRRTVGTDAVPIAVEVPPETYRRLKSVPIADHWLGIPIRLDPTMPPHEIRVVSEA